MNLFTLAGKIYVDNSSANKEIDNTTAKAKGAGSSISGSLSNIGGSLSNMGSKVSAAGQSVQDFSGKMMSWGTSGATGKLAVTGIATATAALTASIPAAIKRIDTLNNSSKVFANMGFKATDTSKAMKILQDGIQGLPTPLNEAVSGLQMISSATNDVELGSKVFTAMNHAILGFGGSTEQVSNATVQLSQALANGKIDAETWNSMMNSQMGPTLAAIARQMGKTTGQLKSGLSDGSISVKQFEDALIDMDVNGGGGMKSLQQIAKDAMGGIGTGIANAKTAITRGMADILSAIGSSNISGAISTVGTAVENAMKQVAGAISSTVSFVQANSSWLMPIITSVATFIGSIVGLKAAAILLTPVINALGGGLKILGTILSVAFSPIGLIVAALAAVGGAMYLFFTRTDQGKMVWQQLIDFFEGTVLPMFDRLKPKIGQAIDGVIDVFNNAKTIIDNVMQAIADFISDHWDLISAAISAVMGVIGAVISQGVQLWQTAIFPIIQTIVSFIQDNWQNIVVIIQAVLVFVLGLIVTAMFLWQNAIFPALLAIANTVSLVFNNIMTIISGILNIIAGIINVIVAVITGNWSAAWNGIVQIFSGIWQVISGVVMTYINIIVGVLQAGWGLISAAVMAVWTPIATFISGVWQSISSAVSSGVQTSLNFITSVWGGMVGIVSSIWGSVVSALASFFDTINSIVVSVFNGIVAFISGAFTIIQTAFTIAFGLINSIVTSAMNLLMVPIRLAFQAFQLIVSTVMGAIWGIIQPILSMIVSFYVTAFTNIYNNAVNAFTMMYNIISSVVTTIWNVIVAVWTPIAAFTSSLFNSVRGVVSSVWNSIRSVISSVVSGVVSSVSAAWNVIVSVTRSVFSAVMSVASSVWNGIRNTISSVVNGIRSVVSSVWNGIRSVTSSVFNAIKSIAISVWNGIKSTISSVVNGIKSTVSGVWNGIKSVTTSVWNGIKSAITSPIQAAKGVISGIVDSIKRLFNFKLKFPDIKIPHFALPHFSVSGGFDLKQWAKGRGFPSLNVDWYAKGGLMTSPTMFGMNGDRPMVGGEAGNEAILPLNDKVFSSIAKGINGKMNTQEETSKDVTITQNITMPATETPREFARTTRQQFQTVFDKA